MTESPFKDELLDLFKSLSESCKFSDCGIVFYFKYYNREILVFTDGTFTCTYGSSVNKMTFDKAFNSFSKEDRMILAYHLDTIKERYWM